VFGGKGRRILLRGRSGIIQKGVGVYLGDVVMLINNLGWREEEEGGRDAREKCWPMLRQNLASAPTTITVGIMMTRHVPHVHHRTPNYRFSQQATSQLD